MSWNPHSLIFACTNILNSQLSNLTRILRVFPANSEPWFNHVNEITAKTFSLRKFELKESANDTENLFMITKYKLGVTYQTFKGPSVDILEILSLFSCSKAARCFDPFTLLLYSNFAPQSSNQVATMKSRVKVMTS